MVEPVNKADIDAYSINTDDAFGFDVKEGTVNMAIVNAADKSSYLGLELGLLGAELVGIEGLTLTASGSVLINTATDENGDEKDDRINWATATDPAGLLPSFSNRLISDVELRVEGNAAVDVFGILVGTGGFSMDIATTDITTGNPNLGTLSDVSLMAFSLSSLNADSRSTAPPACRGIAGDSTPCRCRATTY